MIETHHTQFAENASRKKSDGYNSNYICTGMLIPVNLKNVNYSQLSLMRIFILRTFTNSNEIPWPTQNFQTKTPLMKTPL